jgi:DNA-binding GntR family transcriptional regulator
MIEYDIAFHQALLELAGDDDLVETWRPIAMRMTMHYSRHDQMSRIDDEHIAILDALRERDVEKAIKALEANIQ